MAEDTQASNKDGSEELVDRRKFWRRCSECYHERPYALAACPKCGNLKFSIEVDPGFLTKVGYEKWMKGEI